MAGDGDSQKGGLATYQFSYTPSTNPSYINYWSTKTVVTNPDASTDTVYTNYAVEVMFDDHYDPAGASHTEAFYAYNSLGQLSLAADPSAVRKMVSVHFFSCPCSGNPIGWRHGKTTSTDRRWFGLPRPQPGQ